MDGDFLSKRKQDSVEPDEVRERIVKVRFNDSELAYLDCERGRISRSETLRFLLLQKMPPSVPSINRDAWIELSRAAANLNQIAHKLNTGEAVDVSTVAAELQAFRDRLIGANL